MDDCLATLHDADKCCLRLILSVLCHSFMCLLVLLLSLFKLNLVDLDAELRIVEGEVDAEGVGHIDVAAFGEFIEDTRSTTGKRLERSFELGVGCR